LIPIKFSFFACPIEAEQRTKQSKKVIAPNLVKWSIDRIKIYFTTVSLSFSKQILQHHRSNTLGSTTNHSSF
jgi:hypothetical protein